MTNYKIVSTGPNTRELRTIDMTLLISYNTPVAVHYHGLCDTAKTSTKWSNTTTKHINKFLWGRKNPAIVEQTKLDAILKEFTGRERLD